MTTPQTVLPGQAIAQSSKSHPGPGTHVGPSGIASSLAGTLSTSRASTSVTRPGRTPLLPTVNATVLGRITRLRTREAHLAIDVVDGVPAAEPFSGVIRVQDVRATEKDKVRIETSFRVGDVVRAVVVSLGDERSYYCSTARNELGVVLAVSDGREPLFAVSWREMRDASGRVEARKVAKPD